MNRTMDAILLAGGIPGPDEPLYQESRGQSKALIELAGKPMAQWLLDALSGSKHIGQVVIIGVDASSGLRCEKPLTFVADGGGMLENVLLGINRICDISPDATHALLASTDIPSVTQQIVDWRIETSLAEQADLDYVVVERDTMEARFPGSKRSYIRLRDANVCGGDLNLISLSLASKSELWDRLIGARKNVRRQAALLGYDLLLQLLTRQITLRGAEAKISRRLGIKGRVVISPFAELAMDVDKPEQLALLQRDLAARVGA